MIVEIRYTAINRCFCELDLRATIIVVGDNFIRMWLNESQLRMLRFSGIHFAKIYTLGEVQHEIRHDDSDERRRS